MKKNIYVFFETFADKKLPFIPQCIPVPLSISVIPLIVGDRKLIMIGNNLGADENIMNTKLYIDTEVYAITDDNIKPKFNESIIVARRNNLTLSVLNDVVSYYLYKAK